MPTPQQDYYALLGIRRDSSPEDIKRAYLKAAQKLHPDKNTTAGDTEIFLDVQQAYEALSNPQRRALYDATLPKETPAPTLPYEYRVFYSRTNLVRMKETQMLYVIIELQAPPEARRNSAPPLNVALVLDRSTSMQGEKMDVVKSTAIQVMRNLRPNDVFSVVAFSDRAEVVIPAAYQQDRSRLEARIQMIRPGGATEIFQGLEAGTKEIMRTHDPKRINHIILITDGHTYGDEQHCLELATKLAERGIGVSSMGIGMEWNDVFLDVLSTRTGMSSAYIANPQDIKKILLEKFNSLAQIYAEDATLNLTPIEGMELSYAFRLQPDPTPLTLENGKLRLGAIFQDTPTRIIFEYIIQPKAVQSDATLCLDGTLNVAIAAHPIPIPTLEMRLQRPVSDSPSADPPPSEIRHALSRLMLYRMQERARKEAESGDVESATQRLQLLATTLLSQGERSLAQTILLEVDTLLKQNTLSEEGSKRIKYGTRALILAQPKKE